MAAGGAQVQAEQVGESRSGAQVVGDTDQLVGNTVGIAVGT